MFCAFISNTVAPERYTGEGLRWVEPWYAKKWEWGGPYFVDLQGITKMSRTFVSNPVGTHIQCGTALGMTKCSDEKKSGSGWPYFIHLECITEMDGAFITNIITVKI
jgi:hypothetical protein